MICEIRNNEQEVVLRNPTFPDVLAVFYLWLHKDREIAFSKPEEDSDADNHE